MSRSIGVGIAIWALMSGAVQASTIEVEAIQTGGFFAEGLPPSNSPTFQNYFVGYGTTPGTGRTLERRSFFVFPLSGVDGPIESASLHLRLPFGGLIYGKGPGDPAVEFVASDPVEMFQLGATFYPSEFVTSPTLTSPAISAIFDSFAMTPVADPFEFHLGSPLPPGSDGMGSHVVITFDGLGLAVLNGALTSGEVVLTGWMPTWSSDIRPALPGSPVAFFEASELIFGLTDVHTGAVPKPMLSITTAPVPLPASLVFLLSGLAVFFRRLPWMRTAATGLRR